MAQYLSRCNVGPLYVVDRLPQIPCSGFPIKMRRAALRTPSRRREGLSMTAEQLKHGRVMTRKIMAAIDGQKFDHIKSVLFETRRSLERQWSISFCDSFDASRAY